MKSKPLDPDRLVTGNGSSGNVNPLLLRRREALGQQCAGHLQHETRAPLLPRTSLTRDFVQVVLGIAVTVVFQGNFEKDGYRLGRLAAGLYRTPPPQGTELGQMIEGEEPKLPQVGYEGGARCRKFLLLFAYLFWIDQWPCHHRTNVAVCPNWGVLDALAQYSYQRRLKEVCFHPIALDHPLNRPAALSPISDISTKTMCAFMGEGSGAPSLNPTVLL